MDLTGEGLGTAGGYWGLSKVVDVGRSVTGMERWEHRVISHHHAT